MTKGKKVVLLIVEGNSEETLLHDRLRSLFKKYDIRIEAQHGDILFSFQKRRKSIKSLIGETVKEFMLKRKFKMNDMLAVLHVIDTDGCLISNENVIIDKSQGALTRYKQDCISVLDERQQKYIIARNEERSKNIYTMNSVESIIRGKVPYQMYYFSRNLEHVLFNEPNPQEDTKIEELESFLEKLEVPIEDYLDKYMPMFTSDTNSEKYKESWRTINQGTSSLNRATNVPLLFEYIHMKT